MIQGPHNPPDPTISPTIGIPPMRVALLDTCVVVDAVLSSRPRHAASSELVAKLKALDYRFPFPGHGLFEILQAIKSERQSGATTMAAGFITDLMLISIDESFAHAYLDLNLPHMPAGDLIFLSIAAKERVPLITEDASLYKKAKTAGVPVFTVAEFLPLVT